MRIRPGILIAIVVLFIVLFGGRQLGWFGGKPLDPAHAPEQTSTAPGEAPATVTETPTATKVLTAPPTTPMVKLTPQATILTVPAPPTNSIIADWEERIDAVLTGDEDEALKAKKLLAIFPNLPEDGQVEAAQHISNLLPDEQYADLAHTLTNAAMPEAVLDVLMTDVLNRPNKIKLDTLLDVARMPNHPKAEEAMDILEVFLDNVDWEAVKKSGNWQSVVDEKEKWLKENPDDDTPAKDTPPK